MQGVKAKRTTATMHEQPRGVMLATKAKDTIPLNDYLDKGESLQKIHAHSSAETSGLGDSLQRIHTLSSTETSGVGETLPSPAGAQSLENISARAKASPVRSARSFDAPERSPTKTSSSRQKPSRSSLAAMHERHHKQGGRRNAGDRRHERDEGVDFQETDSGPILDEPTDFDDLFHRHAQEVRNKYSTSEPPQPRKNRGHISVSDFEVALYMNQDDVTSTFLKVKEENQSAWMRWSQDRRASFKKRLDSIEQRQKEIEKTRVSTPVKKARKESMMFVSPRVDEDDLDEPDALLHQKPKWMPQEIPKPQPPPPVIKDGKLTVNQLNVLIAFWEHDIFVRCRYFGIFFSILALVALVVSTTSSHWSVYEEPDRLYIHSGLWYNCSSTPDSVDETCNHFRRDWQSAVIGLLVFAVIFGVLATALTVCGLYASTLLKKLYYYHSAGEIYFICALATAGALGIYRLAIMFDPDILTSQLHYGFMVGWVGTLFYFLSAFCMTLDEMVRKVAVGCSCAERKDSTIV